ncbi:TetR/AcrR family transcriptional regulator [Antrihabitans sp. YC2-6]|uniref:TetR/AcrR family transcriptional regulator n=1 Tax=Antrihabitans sp. YC2-6 TaxID=2799498 RepID=UPI0018F3A468|nr:TetR/AcrR family transcriptional regulator [Antrihabitans sp. YC2-6]MBJ8347524.1 TetR/AcrR family transcriptional regulator [Antrihabitans sp. YC2-6]
MTAERNGREGDAGATPVRRRPRDRKAQIVKIAAAAFGERGYYSVGVDEIAAEVGISGPALYRHFPNKYALLVAVADNVVNALLDATAAAAELPAPSDQLYETLRTITSVTIENRRGGGIYRWEGHYLDPADRARIRELWDEVNLRVARPLRALRPQLDDASIATLAAAALSVIASITAHRLALGTRRTEVLICDMATAVLGADLPPVGTGSADEQKPDRGLAVLAKREVLIATALEFIHTRGYHEASIEDIGAAAGMNASSVYRHFSSKAELLAAVFYRASERVAVVIADALAESDSPVDALQNLARRYVATAFSHPSLMSVYYVEFGNLPPHERKNLRLLQRQHVDQWAHLVTSEIPELSQLEARFRVHAALGLVLDIGRLVRFDTNPEILERVSHLMLTVLLAADRSAVAIDTQLVPNDNK